jgi:hypothetical protein
LQDLRGGIERVARFLGKSLSEDQLEKLTQHLTFENLSKNSAVNKEDGKTSGSFNENGQFMRKGNGNKRGNSRLISQNRIVLFFTMHLVNCFLGGNVQKVKREIGKNISVPS